MGWRFTTPRQHGLVRVNRISVAEYDGYILALNKTIPHRCQRLLDANGMVVELKGNDRAHGHSSESMERVKDGAGIHGTGQRRTAVAGQVASSCNGIREPSLMSK